MINQHIDHMKTLRLDKKLYMTILVQQEKGLIGEKVPLIRRQLHQGHSTLTHLTEKLEETKNILKQKKGMYGVDLDLLPQSASHGEDCPPTSFSENDDEETTGQFDTIAGEPSLSGISVPETDNDLQSRATCERPRRTIKLPTKFQDYVMSVRE